jgi:hypothetical protein
VIHGWTDGQLYAYTAETGAPLSGWNPLVLETEGESIDRAFFNASLANVDADPLPEVLIGTARGDIFAINADGSLVPGFPYFIGGRLFGAPAVWDIDRNGTADIVAIGETAQLVSLEMVGTTVVSTNEQNPWPQFRHDPRNSGVFGSGLGTTPIDLGSLAAVSTGPGRVTIRWIAEGRYDRFVVERATEGEERHVVGETPGSALGSAFEYADEDAPEGAVAQYWITGLSLSGAPETVGPVVVRVQAAPVATRLLQNVPNPFNPRTAIDFVVGEAGDARARSVRLSIYDLQGREVRVLVSGSLAPGQHSAIWDGTDAIGHPVSSGVYVYTLIVGGDLTSRKLVLSR